MSCMNMRAACPVCICELEVDVVSWCGLQLDLNQLESLPDEIGALGKLERLSVHGNKLACLPSSIGTLTVRGRGRGVPRTVLSIY